jgi:RHS repeat-associated protein
LRGAGHHSAGTTPNNYLFSGEQFDPDLNLYYNRARYLSTGTGRFWTMDTDEGNDEVPLSVHKYVYANVNPVDGLDPSGQDDIGATLDASMTLDQMPNIHFGLNPNYSLFGGSRNAKSLSDRGLTRIKIYESPVFLHGSPDSDNNCTIGYGHVFDWHNGCTEADKKMTITEPAASALLQSDIADRTNAIARRIYSPLAQQELDALISFVFNAGLPDSIVGQINLGHYNVIPVFFSDYVYATVAGGKKKLGGLVARRQDEGVLWEFGIYRALGQLVP